jgi:glycerophosphoryl diester phosphodiesterase
MLAPGLFEHLRARGIPVWFMLVNDERELDLAHKHGATAVLTDRPRWVKERMRERNIRFQKIE